MLQEISVEGKKYLDWEEVTYNMKEICMAKLGNFNMRSRQ
jgi:hypothetical protein